MDPDFPQTCDELAMKGLPQPSHDPVGSYLESPISIHGDNTKIAFYIWSVNKVPSCIASD